MRDKKSVFFQEKTPERDRKIYKLFAIILGILVFFMFFPGLELFNRVRPFIFGFPLLYGWVIIAILSQFIILALLYSWEMRRKK